MSVTSIDALTYPPVSYYWIYWNLIVWEKTHKLGGSVIISENIWEGFLTPQRFTVFSLKLHNASCYMDSTPLACQAL